MSSDLEFRVFSLFALMIRYFSQSKIAAFLLLVNMAALVEVFSKLFGRVCVCLLI